MSLMSVMSRATTIMVVAFLAFVAFVAGWWWLASPPPQVQIAPSFILEKPAADFDRVAAAPDWLTTNLVRTDNGLPGHDDVVLLDDQRHALVTGMDGWIWHVDLETNKAERFADVPLIAAGARLAPSPKNRLYFCASRLSGERHAAGEQVGLYSLDIETRAISLLVGRVPETGIEPSPAEVVIPNASRVWHSVADLAASNSRALEFCNDLDVSADGKRIYFTEPFAYEGASMGGGAWGEAVSLGRNARIWLLDLENSRIAQVARGMIFADGILVEESTEDSNADTSAEASLLVTETVAFRIVRLFLAGPRAGTSEPFATDLPGMPDGLDRDKSGRIWTGLLKLRSSTIERLHANPWIKPFILRLPRGLLPVSKATGIAAFDATNGRPLFWAAHDGSKVNDVAVVIPGDEELYLASFDRHASGLVRVEFPPFESDR
ncbi:MAG: sugar lactone lactonase YvrE [Hyphomicrobiaceae bacterium]|jgi:sugar lactone lactonase YvrE